MNPVTPDAIVRPRLIDADRLTLPLELLDLVALSLLGLMLVNDADVAEVKRLRPILNMALTELHRVQDQALVESQP